MLTGKQSSWDSNIAVDYGNFPVSLYVYEHAIMVSNAGYLNYLNLV